MQKSAFPLFISVLLLLVLWSCSPQKSDKQQSTDPENMTVSTQQKPPRIAIDAGVIVGDMEQALSFYRDLLELTVIAEIQTSLIGKGRMVQLQHGASLIKLVEMEQPPSQSSPSGLSTAFGYRYITLMIKDMDAMMQKIEQADVPIALPLTTLGNGAQIVMVQDPDGNIVEFVQEAKSPSTKDSP
ncbi:MAG: VOC family protein [Bacteroidota bacterium]